MTNICRPWLSTIQRAVIARPDLSPEAKLLYLDITTDPEGLGYENTTLFEPKTELYMELFCAKLVDTLDLDDGPTLRRGHDNAEIIIWEIAEVLDYYNEDRDAWCECHSCGLKHPIPTVQA